MASSKFHAAESEPVPSWVSAEWVEKYQLETMADVLELMLASFGGDERAMLDFLDYQAKRKRPN